MIKWEHIVVNRNPLKCYPLNYEIDISVEYIAFSFDYCCIKLKNNREIKKGIVLAGGGSGNFAHFMCDIIPRLTLVNGMHELDDYPIILDLLLATVLLKY